MSEHLLPGGAPGEAPVYVTLRRSARARRLSLRISSLDGRVTLTLPNRVPLREGLAFATEKSDWIRAQLARQPQQVVVDIGATLPIEGRAVSVVAGQGRQVRLTTGQIAVPEAQAPRRLERFLRELAHDRLTEASDDYAERLGRKYTRITLRDTRSRWGSCSSSGALMYSWRLVLAPPAVLNYVAAHEIAHLAHMDHSRAFWDTLGHIHGPYATERDWLRTEGNALHRYKFDG